MHTDSDAGTSSNAASNPALETSWTDAEEEASSYMAAIVLMVFDTRQHAMAVAGQQPIHVPHSRETLVALVRLPVPEKGGLCACRN